MCVWSRQRSCLLGGFSLESSLRSPRYLSNCWTTVKNWCVFVWPCVVLRVFAGMSLPEGKLEGGFFPNMSVRGGWYEAGVGARCTFAHSVQTSYLIWTRGVRCVCGRWSLSGPSRTQRGRVDDICLPYPPPPPPAADSHRPALSKFGFYPAQRRTRYRSLVPLKAAIVSSCEEADLLLNHHKITCLTWDIYL